MFPASVIFVVLAIFGADGQMKMIAAPYTGEGGVAACESAAHDMAKEIVNGSAGKVVGADAHCVEFHSKSSA